MKIVSKGKKVVSTKLIVPIDGMIEIDSNGFADVSAKCAALLVNNTNDWEFVKKQKEFVEEAESDDPNEDNEMSEEQSEREILEERINSSTLEQLRNMCVEAEFPEEEWKNMSKKLLVKYMLKKYDEA